MNTKLINVLSTLDIDSARTYLNDSAKTDGDETILIALHKARYESNYIDRQLRHISALWLLERGHGRYNGRPLLPLGILPE